VTRERTRRERVLSTLLALAVGGVVLGWLLAGVDLDALAATLARAGWWKLALALPLVPLIQWLRAWRFALLLSGRAVLPSRVMVEIAARLIVLNFLLPFRLGELGFPVMMKRAYGTEALRSAGILLLARLMDLFAVAAVLCLAAAALPAGDRLGWPAGMLVAAGIALLTLAVLLVDLLLPLRWIALRLPRLGRLLELALSGAAMVQAPGARALASLLTLATWLLHALIGWLAATAVAPQLAAATTTLAAAAANLAFALPVPAIAGLGPPQAGWVAALGLAGVPWPDAVATALLSHAVILAGILLLGLLTLLGGIWRPAGAAPRPDAPSSR